MIPAKFCQAGPVILAKGYQNFIPVFAKKSSLPVKDMIRLLSSQSSLSQTEP